MKRVLLLTAALTLIPTATAAQVEIGIDAGLMLDNRSNIDDVFQLNVPTARVRIGFPQETWSFETLLSFDIFDSNGTLTSLDLTPGVNIHMGDGGFYLRPEGAMMLISGDGDTETEFGAGVAGGVRNAIDGGPAHFRFEVGYDRFFDAEVNRFRALVGVSVVLGG